MTRTEEHRTRTDSVYDRLRADILAGRLRPGGRLAFAALQQRCAASVGVIREALIRLAAEGLVRSEPHVGFTVTPLSRADLIDLTSARVVLESLVFGLSISHGNPAWEAQAVASHHLLRRTPLCEPGEPAGVNPQWAQAHLVFHRALLAGCPNRRLRGLAESLRDSAELYRAWSQSIGSEPDRDVAAEHEALLAAAVDRDPAAGADLLAAHIQRTADNLATVAGGPDPATVAGEPDSATVADVDGRALVAQLRFGRGGAGE